MEKKKFNHQKIEKCNLSGKSIDTTKEKYSIILDCDQHNIYSVRFYKSELLFDLIKGKMNLIRKELVDKHQRLANQMLGKLKPMLNIGQN